VGYGCTVIDVTAPENPHDEHHEHDEPTVPPSDMVSRAAQRYGVVGAMLAGSMVAFDRLLGRKPKEEAPVVFEASGEPGNIDDDGITLILDDNTTIMSPAPHARRQRSRRVRRRRRSTNGE
jgi:hypothetical protein